MQLQPHEKLALVPTAPQVRAKKTPRFMDLHGGAVSIDSHPGTGTTVRLWLPEARIVEG